MSTTPECTEVEDEACPRCGSISWGMDEAGRAECMRCRYVEAAHD